MARAVVAALLALAVTCLPAYAQKFPSKPVRIVVPYAPGGPLDDAHAIWVRS